MRIMIIILCLVSFFAKGQINGFYYNTLQSKDHPNYGVIIANDTFSIPHEINLAKSLGVNYFRYAMFVTQWNGVNNGFQRLNDSGMNVVLNINYTTVTTPIDLPTNMIGYADTVRMMLDTYQPDLVVAENEPLTANFINTNMPRYITMLQTISPIVHAHTTPSGKQMKLADGGITTNGIYVLTYRWLKANFSQAVADTFGNRCLPSGIINAANNPCTNAGVEENAANVQMSLDAAKMGVTDYVNIHFKEVITPGGTDAQDSTQTQITKYVIRYVKLFVEITTGKPCITNETGQKHNEQPLLVTNMLQMFYNLGFKYTIWYSGDNPAGVGARSLFNQDGSIRPNGVAFQTFIFGLSHLGIP